MQVKYYTKARFSNKETQREIIHRGVAYQAASESIVLLENNGVLPIKENSKIALYGAGAVLTVKGGVGSGEVNERYSVNIKEGLEQAGFIITTQKYLKAVEQEQADKLDNVRKNVARLKLSAIKDAYTVPLGPKITEQDIKMSNTDTAIYVVSRQEGEGSDRKLDEGANNLTKREINNLKKMVECYDKTILVMNLGCSLDMSFLEEVPKLGGVVYFCEQGMEGGRAFGDIVSGKVTPSGKLVDTWAVKYEDIPFHDEFSYLNGNLTDEYYKEGIFVGYRYFDTFKVKPKYEFGYGLSYTEFAIECEEVVLSGIHATAKVNVTNQGDTYTGKEIVQLYVACPDGQLKKEAKRLTAFEKTKLLAPNESQSVMIDFDLTALGSYDETRAVTILEPGNYTVMLGNSSRNIKAVAILRLDKEVILSKHKNICPLIEPFEELKAPKEKVEWDTDLPIFVIDSDSFITKTHNYSGYDAYRDKRVDAVMSKLTDDEKISLVYGAGMFGTKGKLNVPGSIGNTTTKLIKKGIPNVALCDGPAGLRVIQRTAKISDRKTKQIDPALSVFQFLPNFLRRRIMADPKKYPVLYQFTTAFPVSCAMAQTWNVELQEQVGRCVAIEMLEYGVTYWLSPAMNIHRNPLCGRNYEYFSEDPYVTGKMAAALIRGTQSQAKGITCVPKHFCCNNQESNRMKVSENIHERALREIYLKGFEIAVKESNPRAMMTSYNKVNHVYTNSSEDLCTYVLRNEWGFDGCVMTDWVSTSKKQADSAMCMKAGNDMIMPGFKNDLKQIKAGLKDGRISMADIERSARQVLRSILHSDIYKEIKRN